MMEEIRKLLNELKNVRTIDLASISQHFLEKCFWIMIGILGIGWAIYFLPNQFQLWSNNPSILMLKQVPLSDISYPTLSILPQRITKYDAAERLGNYIFPDHIPEKLKRLRGMFFDALIEVMDNDDESHKSNLYDECIGYVTFCKVYMS